MLGTVPGPIPGVGRRLVVVAVTFLSVVGCSSSDDDDAATATEAHEVVGDELASEHLYFDAAGLIAQLSSGEPAAATGKSSS